MTRPLFLSLVLLTLLGCAPRGALDMPDLPVPDAAVTQPVFLATNRQPAPGDARDMFAQDFGGARDATLRYGRLDVSVPPAHLTGRIEWPRDELADPARHFVVTGGARYDGASDFLRALRQAGGAEVLVFVHGYNTNNAEAAYRLAQIAHDFDAQLPVIAYSWPSAGDPRGYAYDRDSVVFSRDGLEQLLVELTVQGGRDVLLIAHSMGSQLVMEVLRQMSIGGQRQALSRLSGVGLISPDIDEDVFLRQADRIDPFPRRFLLMVSSQDRVLGLSARLTGKPTRLGSISDPARLAELPVEVLDLTPYRARGDGAGHNTAFAAPAAIEMLRRISTARLVQ